MLILIRKRDERILIRNQETGEEIVILLVRSGTRAARIGIQAPQTYRIRRAELDGRTE